MKNELPYANVLRLIFLLVLAATAGALAGTWAAFTVTPITYSDSSANIQPLPTVPTSTVNGPSLVRLEPRLAAPLLPSNFLTRRASPVAGVYRKAKGVTLEERSLTDERLLGQAIALTSDGWFLTSMTVLGSYNISDLSLWHNGKAYAVTQAMSDKINGTVFLKIQAREITAPAFGDVRDLVIGSELWTERRARSFAPTLVTSLIVRLGTDLSSEISGRRIELYGTADKGDIGSPVWDPRGSFMGIIESGAGETLRIIPATSISASLSTLLAEDAIVHALLGVRSIDLAAWRIDGERGELPERGALLRDDRKTGKSAVSKDSPAAKAGLKVGDVILSVDRDILDGSRDLGEVLSEYRANSTVSLRINRDGQESDVVVTLGKIVTGEQLVAR